MQENNRLLALAKLKVGVKPRIVAEECDISYGQALQLKKELEHAEERNAIHSLINVEEAVFDQLMETVKTSLTISADDLDIQEDVIEGELQKIGEAVTNAKILERELTDTAIQLAIKMRQLALVSNNSETLLTLTEGIAKLQNAFFAKGTNVQINQLGNRFETFLKD